MLLFKKRISCSLQKVGLFLTVMLALTVLSSCGFKPIYGTHAEKPSMNNQLSTVSIASIPNKEGLVLWNFLVDRIYVNGRPNAPKYTVHIARLKERSTSLGIRKDATSTRAQLRIDARLRLVDIKTGQTVLERQIRSINSYNVLDSQFTTLVTRKDAQKRALSEISEKITNELILYFNKNAE